MLDPKRNPGLGRDGSKGLADCLGVTKVIWLEHGFDGDVTGGHVDNVACFVRPGVVMVLTCRDPEDANFAGSRTTSRACAARAMPPDASWR